MVADEISEANLPFPDEGWWESILAEDQPPTEHTQRALGETQKTTHPVDWEKATRLFTADEIIDLVVVGYNRGGLLVEGGGLSGFVPCSHLVCLPAQVEEDQKEEFLSPFLGRNLRLKIIECIPDEMRIVLSERAAKAAAGKRTELLSTLKKGQHVLGEITNVTDFGAFVDLGGVEGLIHISELSWGRVSHPGQIVNVGQQVEVIVLDVSPERCRIALSLKRLLCNPWETAESHYPPQTIVSAIITSLAPFGAFARLEEGLEGLIHATEIPLPSNTPVNSYLVPGQAVQVRILQVDAARQRLGLSMRLNP